MWRALLLLSCMPLAAWSAEKPWAQLKPGLSQLQTSQLLGVPVLASRAGQFEVANYDECGELLFVSGRLVAWTAPRSAATAVAPKGTWNFVQHPVALTRSANRAPPRAGAVPVRYRW